MRNGTKKVSSHSFLFAFRLHRLLVFDLGSQSTGEHRDDDHGDGGKQVGGDGKIQMKIGKCKSVVDGAGADEGGNDSVDIALGQYGDQKHREGDGGGDMLGDIQFVLQQHADGKGCAEDQKCEHQILQPGQVFLHGHPPVHNLSQ